MRQTFLLALFCICLCGTEAVHSRLIQEIRSARTSRLEQQQDLDTSLVQTNTKAADPDIIFVPPEDEPRQDLDPTKYHPVPLIGTQPPKERDIPQAPSSYKFAPRIISQKDLQPDTDLYGDDTTSDDKTSLVTTSDSQDPTTPGTDSTSESAVESSSNPTPAAEPTPETDPALSTTAPAESTTDEPSSEGSTGSVDDYETDSSTGVADESENAEDAKHKFRNALDDDEIPKWFNVKDFVDEENGLEFEKARDEASKIVEEELSKFKTEVLGVIMEQFSNIISGDGESEDDESDSRRGGWGGDEEGDGESYHEGYLDGEDDASHAPDDYDYEWEDKEPGNEAYDEDYDGEYDDQAVPAAHAGSAADTADEAGDDTVVDDASSASTSSSDKTVIAALQAQVDQLKSDLEAARNAAPTPTPTTTASATPTDVSATPTDSSAVSATPTDSTSTPAVSASAVISSDGVVSAPVSVGGAVSTEPASTSGEPAVAGGDDEEVDTAEDGGDDDDYDDYDDDYGDDYDDYDYDYDDDGGEEWGHDHHGHWGRKYGGGGGWGRRGGGGGNSYGGMSAPAVSAGSVRSYSQSGGQGGFVTTVNANTPKTITTVIGTTISPNGNGQSTISQNVERVQVDEYDEAVGTPGFTNAPAIPVEPDGGIGSTPTPATAEPTPAASATPATPTTTPPTTAPAAGVLTHGLTQQALAAVNAIRAQGEAILAPVHQPTGVDIKNLKALEDSSDVLTRAADEVAKLSAFREKRRLEKLLG